MSGTVKQRRHSSFDPSAAPNVRSTDTVLVGNGPSALLLSYLLHGNVPRYDGSTFGPHPDPVLHSKLSRSAHTSGTRSPRSRGGPCLYDVLQSQKDVEFLTEHFGAAASMSYSNQALPVNTLLDTLVRPNADTEAETKSRIKWEWDPARRVEHMAIGTACEAGGQWTEDPVSTNWDIGTLSYAEMFSLPGYTFQEHYRKLYNRQMPDLTRPSRRDVASYYATYPRATGISPSIYSAHHVQRVSRTAHGFQVRIIRKKTGSVTTIHAKHLVLASGIYSHTIPPPPIFHPLTSPRNAHPPQMPVSPNAETPLLVIGSGFTAADVILSQPPSRRIVHLYNWKPSTRPSPLKACNPQAYPEYAQIYRRMKLGALSSPSSATITSPSANERADPLRDWNTYEGFPNAQIIHVAHCPSQPGLCVLRILTEDGGVQERLAGGLKYCVGRRGSLDYLSTELRREVGVVDAGWVSADTMRRRVEAGVEVARNVCVVGSLTGDSLVRLGFGGVVMVAGRVVREAEKRRWEGREKEGEVPQRRWSGEGRGCVLM